MDDRQKRFLEKNFTKILGVFSCLLVSLLVVPYAFRHVEEEALSELKGHLSNLETHFGATPEKNTFEFSVDEFPSRTFLVGGLRAVDQSILTNNESIGSWMNFSVEKSSFKKNEGPIRVFQLSSQKNTYLTANDSALTAYKERIFSGLLVLIFLSVAMNLGFSLRDSYRTLKLESDRGNIDELLLAITKNPILSITGFCLVLIILNVVFLPRVVLLYSVLGTVLGYGYCIFWLRTRASSSPWLASIATRDEERRNHLSERLKTAAPKHVKAVELLLKGGANVNARDTKGQTPLFIASAAGAAEAVGLLLRKGGDPNVPDLLGTTPLMAAAKIGHLGLVLKLIDGKAKVNIANQEGATALSLAQNDKHSPAVMDALLKASKKEEKEEKEAAKKLEEEKKREESKKKDPEK